MPKYVWPLHAVARLFSVSVRPRCMFPFMMSLNYAGVYRQRCLPRWSRQPKSRLRTFQRPWVRGAQFSFALVSFLAANLVLSIDLSGFNVAPFASRQAFMGSRLLPKVVPSTASHM